MTRLPSSQGSSDGTTRREPPPMTHSLPLLSLIGQPRPKAMIRTGLHLDRYPAAYVRWTENRNLAEYLRLLAEEKVRVAPLIGATFPVEQAARAYAALQGEPKPLIVLLSYPQGEKIERVVPNPQAVAAAPGRVRLALVGAGGFAKGMHVPNLRALSELYAVQAVVSRTGHNAQATARLLGARYATTDYAAALADSQVDAVLIATRHDTHAAMALAALEAGKHVLVEKPLALSAAELARLLAFFERPADDDADLAHRLQSPLLAACAPSGNVHKPACASAAHHLSPERRLPAARPLGRRPRRRRPQSRRGVPYLRPLHLPCK